MEYELATVSELEKQLFLNYKRALKDLDFFRKNPIGTKVKFLKKYKNPEIYEIRNYMYIGMELNVLLDDNVIYSIYDITTA